jgi:diguanylate cyclase (GGDEF)-like protein
VTDLALAGLISYIGLLAQLAGAALLVALFLVLRRQARRRPYFAVWGRAWGALAVALLALTARYQVLPALGGGLDDRALSVRALYLVYQLGKLLHFALLLVGFRRFVRGPSVRSMVPAAVTLAVLLAVGSTLVARDLDGILVAQAVWAVTCLTTAAGLLLRLPRSRRTLGTLLTAGMLLTMAAAWVAHGVAFGLHAGGVEGGIAGAVEGTLRYNSFLDLLLQMLLAYGMVLLLMEDAHRELDAAYSRLEIAYDRLRSEATQDQLTGCLNRRAFAAGVGLERARGDFGAVVLLDLDNLKRINDATGHAAGDRLLCHFAEVLRRGLRPADTLYRWGGDEFLVVLPGARAARVEPRLRTLIEEAPPLVSPAAATLEASLGCADYSGEESLAAAIEEADRLMYSDKRARKHGLRSSGATASGSWRR